jgi:tetratricopeptide (TPR) repeat protein
MAKKKRKPAKKKPPTPRKPSDEGIPSELADRRVLEGIMRGFVRDLTGEGGEETPLEKAQELMYEAFAAPTDEQRIALARKALTISPDCADAYVLLAEHARNRKEAMEFYEQAVAAGERALGPDLFRDGVGDFWGILETRPYMRARLGLAETLWTAGRRDEAVAHLQDMLRLNPGDNQGLRLILINWLLTLDRSQDLERLLQQYPDEGSAHWAYTKVLTAFRQHGDAPEAAKVLQEARKVNKYVVTYLLSLEPMPPEQPPYYSPGDRSEAVMYAAAALSAWKGTPGAITWLRSQEKQTEKPRSRAKTPKAKGPSPTLTKRLLRLPREETIWQADFRSLPQFVEVAGERVRPWMTLVTNRSDDLILAHEISDSEPSWERLWDLLATAMQKPMMGDPHRPQEIQLRSKDLWEKLKPPLDALEIESTWSSELDQLDFVLGELVKQLGGNLPPALLDMPGVTPERVAGFYQAAAHFYRRAPWLSLGYETAIRVECDKFESGPWYAVVMGQSGLTLGLALYDDLKVLTRLWEGHDSEEDHARETVALSVTFEEGTEIPPSDLDAEQEHGWEVAGPEAHPSVFRKERGMSLRPPLAWELELLEACLRTIPDFVASHPTDDSTRQNMEVATAGGKLALTLAWIDD